MKKRISGIESLLLLTALGIAGCAVETSPLDNSVDPAPSKEFAAKGAPGVTADEALTADEQALNEVQEKLRPVADSVEASFLSDPDFANISMDASRNTVIVYREGGETSAARLRLPATNPVGASVQIRAALLGKARVEALVERITQDQSALQASGVEVVTWGPDGEGGPFRIGVKDDLAHARAVLRIRYPDVASVIDVSVQSRPIAAANRMSDSAPYFGGSRINMARDNCTTGFSVRNIYGEYMLTAYHCFDGVNTTVRNGQGTFEGTFVSYDKTPYDAAFIKVSSNNDFAYAGALGNDTAFYQVTSVAHPVNGEIVCAAGSYSGARCNARIGSWIRFNMTNDLTGEVYSVDMWNADQLSHSALAGQGDSGGPLYVGGTSIHARGIISSIATNSIVGCPEGPSTRVCGWRVYFGDAAQIGIRHGLSFTGF